MSRQCLIRTLYDTTTSIRLAFDILVPDGRIDSPAWKCHPERVVQEVLRLFVINPIGDEKALLKDLGKLQQSLGYGLQDWQGESE